MNKQLVMLPVILGGIALASLSASPVNASYDGGCGSAAEKDKLVEKTMTYNYKGKNELPSYKNTNKKNMNARQRVGMNRLKQRMKQLDKSSLMEFKNMLKKFESKMNKNHPNYYLINDLYMLLDELMQDKEMTTKNIVDIVVGTDQVSILKDVVVQLDLVDTLASEGPFTVFAPTNVAFEQLLADLDMTFEELAANEELLRTVVLYHVLPAKVPAKTVLGLTEGTLVETVGGESLRVSTWDGVKVDESNVIKTDIMAANGVIHLIDEVLLPPSVRETLGLPTDRGDENIVTTAINNGNFPTLVAAVQAAGLVDTLAGEGPFTVYAPTETAFADLLANLGLTAEELLANTELLTQVLTYHVVPGFYTADDIVGLDGPTMSPTVEGTSLTIDPNGGAPMVNESNIIATDVYASNGVIHVIDAVLLPPL